jgi:hypothetical protein
MAIHHLTLPSFIEPPPRIPVAARYGGPVLAALRHPSGYRFVPALGCHSEGHGWIERALRRR